MHSSTPITALATLLTTLILLPNPTTAHSWNEQLSLIGSDGHFTGSYGYPRGYMSRTDPGFDGFSMMWLLPQPSAGRTHIDPTDLLCHPSQRNANQSAHYPRLAASPGASIAMKYFENGHVTLPQNQKGKPPAGGPVYIFGTTQPKPDEKLADILQWTTDASGGDKRGRLLSSQNFDDGRCYQINGGPISTDRQAKFPDHVPGQPTSQHEQWCESDVTLPKDAQPGQTLTLYWVWQWPTAPGADPSIPTGKDEYYTTCNDVDVKPAAPPGPIAATLEQQDPQVTAVPSYASRAAISPVPMYANGLGGGAAAPSSANSAPSSPSPMPSPAPAPASAPAPAAAASPASGSNLTPLPLSMFQPAAPPASTSPTAAPASSAAPTGPAAAATPTSMATIAVPAGQPVYVKQGDNLVPLSNPKVKRGVDGGSSSSSGGGAARRYYTRSFGHGHGHAHAARPTGAKFRV